MAAVAESALENSHLKSAQSQGDEIEMSVADINQENVKFILMDGFEYSFSRMLGDAQKWKCTNPFCYAYFKILANQILPGVMAHTHQREVDTATVEENVGTIHQQKVEPPVEQRTERPGGKKTYPAKVKKGQVPSSWHMPDNSGNVAKNPKPSSSGARNTVTRQSPQNPESPPFSGFLSDQDSTSFLLAAFRPGATSPANSPTSFQLAPLRSGAASPAESPSSFQLAPLGSGAASLANSPSPPKSPKLSEMGPPPTPPLSQHSSQHDSDPSSPLPPVFDLVEARYRSSSFSPDFDAYFMEQPPNSPVDNPQSPAAKPTTPSSFRTARITQSSERRKKLAKLAKFNEFKNTIMKLDNEAFGYAVTSLLSELPSKTAEDMRYEIATLLFDVVEENEEKKKHNPSQT